jgi:asparagine synthase (glutamine-hydrolysing)
MSVQFGRWSFDSAPPHLDLQARVDSVLAPYGPDNRNSYHKDGVSVLYRAFHTTKESRLEIQPHISPSGAVITWDGRLDNRAELIDRFNTTSPSTPSADVSIVAAAYDRWGTDCFAKLIGDWALSIWSPNERTLILAKDPIGTRHLYYSLDERQVAWSTILDPLVLFAGRTFALDEEYIAGWFSFFPATHLTPYVGIASVSASHFVRLERGRQTVNKYWGFNPGKTIRYRTDAEYEEHFSTVFSEAIQRRLRCDAPILAELSGGMDSSSIVCVADIIIARGAADTPRLDTLSYYNDSEPNWNCHIDVSMQDPFEIKCGDNTFAATPASGRQGPTESSRQFAAYMETQGSRVVLSGVGGDEVTGGVPTPTPELMDLLATARFAKLAGQLKAWALNKRKPWFHLFLEAAAQFFPPTLMGLPSQMRPAGWLYSGFVKRQRTALTGYPSRLGFFGPLPSFQDNLRTLDAVRRQIACSALSPKPLYEKRYPYLDRNLLEFLFGIPREQIVRPGQRRSLMRRALVGVVPVEILDRKRKAFVVRSPLEAISADWPRLVELSQHMVSSSIGIVEPQHFLNMVKKGREGQEVAIVTLMRTLSVEFWLRELKDRGLLKGGSSSIVRHSKLRGGASLTESLSQQDFT